MGYRNPYITPMWITLLLGLAACAAIDIPLHTVWGLLCYIPWLVVTITAWRYPSNH